MAIDSSDQKITTEAATVLKEPEEAPDDQTDDGADGGQSASADQGQPAAAGRDQNGQFQKQPGRGSRRERRDAWQTQTQQMEQRISERVAQQMQAFQGEFQRMLQSQQPQQPRQEAPRGPDEMQTLEQALQSEIAALSAHDHAKGKPDFSRYNQIRSRMEQLNGERAAMGLLQRMGLTPEAIRNLRQPQREPFGRDTQMAARFYQLVNDFPWINSPENARAVRFYKDYLINAMGRPDTLDTDREAAAYIASQRNLGPRQLPRGNEARYAGMRGGDVGGERAPREIRLPQGVLNALSKDEMARVQSAVFQEDT